MTPKWLLCRAEVSGNAKLLYGLLSSHVDVKGLAPGCTKLAIVKVRMRTLARELLGSDGDADYKTIQRLVKELKEHGLIRAHLNREKSAASDYYLLDHGWMDPQVKTVPRLGSEMGGPQDKPVPSLGSNLSLASGQNRPDPQDKFVLGDKISSQESFQDRAAEIASARAHEHAQAPARADSSSSGKNGRAPLVTVPDDGAIVPDAEQRRRQVAIVQTAEQKKAIAKHDAEKAIRSMLKRPLEEQRNQRFSITSRFLPLIGEEALEALFKHCEDMRQNALDTLRDFHDAGAVTHRNMSLFKIHDRLDQREIDAVLAEPRRPALPVPVVSSPAAAPYRPFRAIPAAEEEGEGEGEDLNEREGSNDW